MQVEVRYSQLNAAPRAWRFPNHLLDNPTVYDSIRNLLLEASAGDGPATERLTTFLDNVKSYVRSYVANSKARLRKKRAALQKALDECTASLGLGLSAPPAPLQPATENRLRHAAATLQSQLASIHASQQRATLVDLETRHGTLLRMTSAAPPFSDPPIKNQPLVCLSRNCATPREPATVHSTLSTA